MYMNTRTHMYRYILKTSSASITYYGTTWIHNRHQSDIIASSGLMEYLVMG